MFGNGRDDFDDDDFDSDSNNNDTFDDNSHIDNDDDSDGVTSEVTSSLIMKVENHIGA